MKNLTTSQNNLGNNTQITNLQISLALAYERTKTPICELNNTIKDILSEFSYLSNNDLKEAIKNGSLGLYGKTYKLSTQEIFIWIRQYEKDNNKLKISNPNNEEIVCYVLNEEQFRRYLPRSIYEKQKESDKIGGYIYKEIKI